MARFLFAKIVFFSSVAAVGLYFCVLGLARHETMSSLAGRHSAVYSEFMQQVARAKNAARSPAEAANATAPKASPYWDALAATRRAFSPYSINLMIAETPQGETDQARAEAKAFGSLKQHPSNWEYTDRRGSNVRSFFSLPTKNLAALVVTTDVQREIDGWMRAAAVPAGIVFALFLSLGFYIAPVGGAAASKPTKSPGSNDAEIERRIEALKAVIAEIGSTIADVSNGLRAVEASSDLRPLDDLAAQIRLLAVNGMIEASRSAPSSPRAFHDVLSEINDLALRARDAVAVAAKSGARGTELRGRVSDLERLLSSSTEGGPRAIFSGSSSATSFRRVG